MSSSKHNSHSCQLKLYSSHTSSCIFWVRKLENIFLYVDKKKLSILNYAFLFSTLYREILHVDFLRKILSIPLHDKSWGNFNAFRPQGAIEIKWNYNENVCIIFSVSCGFLTPWDDQFSYFFNLHYTRLIKTSEMEDNICALNWNSSWFK